MHNKTKTAKNVHNFHVDNMRHFRLLAAILFYYSRSSLKRFPISILILLGIISGGTAIVLSKFSRIETGILKGSWLGSLWEWQSLIDTQHLGDKESSVRCSIRYHSLMPVMGWWPAWSGDSLQRSCCCLFVLKYPLQILTSYTNIQNLGHIQLHTRLLHIPAGCGMWAVVQGCWPAAVLQLTLQWYSLHVAISGATST